MLKDETTTGQFTDFVSVVEPRLRRALSAAFGSELGREATAEALVKAVLFSIGEVFGRPVRRSGP